MCSATFCPLPRPFLPLSALSRILHPPTPISLSLSLSLTHIHTHTHTHTRARACRNSHLQTAVTLTDSWRADSCPVSLPLNVGVPSACASSVLISCQTSLFLQVHCHLCTDDCHVHNSSLVRIHFPLEGSVGTTNYRFSRNPIFPLPEASCFFLTLQVTLITLTLFQSPQVQNLAFVIHGFISFFLKAGPWSFCSSRTVLLAFSQICRAWRYLQALHLYLLQLGSALPVGSAQLARALPSDPLHVPHFRLPLRAAPVKSQPCPPLCLTLFEFSLWYLQILSIYDYYLSFSVGCKLLEYEDFITGFYCCSICDRHSKL